jgi:hypothetical protein
MERLPSEQTSEQTHNRSAASSSRAGSPLKRQSGQPFEDSHRQKAQANTIQRLQDSPLQAAQRQGVDTLQRASPVTASGKLGSSDGLPEPLRSNMEAMSGVALDDVHVHRNSDKPAQMQAHAYAQGRDIYLGAGQEKHLPHEAWHVVQQAQGRVKPTRQLKGKTAINDDQSLEREADMMGAKAMQLKSAPTQPLSAGSQRNVTGNAIQRLIDVKLKVDEPDKKALRAKGKLKYFKEGTKAGKRGWINVDKYRSWYKVENDDYENENQSETLQNEFTNPEAGHALAQQNGGNGSDPENIFAQCGGTNNGKYKTFENTMRDALDEDVFGKDDEVTFVTYLVGKDIKEGKISDHGLPEASDISSEDLSD